MYFRNSPPAQAGAWPVCAHCFSAVIVVAGSVADCPVDIDEKAMADKAAAAAASKKATKRQSTGKRKKRRGAAAEEEDYLAGEYVEGEEGGAGDT